jgi:hypothetical protein
MSTELILVLLIAATFILGLLFSKNNTKLPPWKQPVFIIMAVVMLVLATILAVVWSR